MWSSGFIGLSFRVGVCRCWCLWVLALGVWWPPRLTDALNVFAVRAHIQHQCVESESHCLPSCAIRLNICGRGVLNFGRKDA